VLEPGDIFHIAEGEGGVDGGCQRAGDDRGASSIVALLRTMLPSGCPWLVSASTGIR
jgi:hypothetical protein